jgi:hypothetical protein
MAGQLGVRNGTQNPVTQPIGTGQVVSFEAYAGTHDHAVGGGHSHEGLPAHRGKTREADAAFRRVGSEATEAACQMNGKRMIPIEPNRRVLTPEQEAARRRALERMQRGIPLGGTKLDREELYDERCGVSRDDA